MAWEFRQTPMGNCFYEIGKDCFVSYNPAPRMFGSEGAETALRLNGKYFILLGDWREQYEAAFNKDGIGAMLRLFEQNFEQHGGDWSELPSGGIQTERVLKNIIDNANS